MTLKKDSNFEEKLTFCLKNEEIGELLTRAVESLKICTLMGYFCRKYVMFELKKYIQRNCVVKNDLYGFKNDISNLVNFHTSS